MRATEYALPADVVKVLLDLQTYEWERDIVLMSFCECSRAAMKQEVVEAARKAFIEGATQGFIEGFVARLERDRIVSRKRNQRKREKNDMDARDAAIVAEFPILRGMLGSTEAQYRLASKHGLSRERIGQILRGAKLATQPGYPSENP